MSHRRLHGLRLTSLDLAAICSGLTLLLCHILLCQLGVNRQMPTSRPQAYSTTKPAARHIGGMGKDGWGSGQRPGVWAKIGGSVHWQTSMRALEGTARRTASQEGRGGRGKRG